MLNTHQTVPYTRGVTHALTALQLNKQAGLDGAGTDILINHLPRLYRRVFGHVEHAAEPLLNPLRKHIEHVTTQRALKHIQEGLPKAIPGPYPGTLRVPFGNTHHILSQNALNDLQHIPLGPK